MKKEKTVLFVMPRLPFPTSSGRKTSLYHYCRILSEELNYRLVVAAFLEAEDDPGKKPAFIDKLVILPKASAKKRIMWIIKDSFLLHRKPMQVSLYWSPEAKEIVDQIIQEEKPDYVIGDMVRTTEYIKDADAFRVADLDDRISLRYQRQLDSDIEGINPYGAFLNTVPVFLRSLMTFRPIKIAVLKQEINLLRSYELQMGATCDKTVFVAESEVVQFNAELGKEKAVAIPIGVDTEYFSYRKTGESGNCVGFLGAMSVAHNEHSVRHFVRDIFPSVLQKCPDAKFLVIGGGTSEELRRLASDHVEFVGRVEDVREYLQKCKVFVCPMTFGSGIKTKNLEAMSLGLPVVTSTIGAENIRAVNGHDWIVSDRDEDFAKAVVDLLVDDEAREIIGRNASEYIAQTFTWDVAKERFEEMFSSIPQQTSNKE